MRLTGYSLIHKGKRFGGFHECLEQEENRTLAEDLSLSSNLSLITLEAKEGRGLPEIIKLRLLSRCIVYSIYYNSTLVLPSNWRGEEGC